MNHIIRSKDLTVETKELGGELTSIKDMQGIEYLWQPDERYWAGQAPVLFPMVGSLKDAKAKLRNGKMTTMPRHGLIRKKVFEVVEKTENSITFSIQSDEESLKVYPFSYEVQIKYTVTDRTVTTSYLVKNIGHEILPYTIGGHPAFNCPVLEGERFEDYLIEFEHNETAGCPKIIMADGTLDTDDRMAVIENEKVIKARHSLFDNDALVFDNLKSRSVKVYHPQTGKGVQVDFPKMDYLGVWSAQNGAPFVAFEPWTGMADRKDEGEYFEDKIGITKLEPGDEKETGFDIVIL